MSKASALEGRVKRVPSQSPEWELDDVVVEFHRRVLEIVHAIDDQHGDQRAGHADQLACRRPDRDEGNNHGDLRQRVIGGVGVEDAVHDFDQPPWQWRQLVVTELPFPAVG